MVWTLVCYKYTLGTLASLLHIFPDLETLMPLGDALLGNSMDAWSPASYCYAPFWALIHTFFPPLHVIFRRRGEETCRLHSAQTNFTIIWLPDIYLDDWQLQVPWTSRMDVITIYFDFELMAAMPSQWLIGTNAMALRYPRPLHFEYCFWYCYWTATEHTIC